jgi:hypothetical protein
MIKHRQVVFMSKRSVWKMELENEWGKSVWESLLEKVNSHYFTHPEYFSGKC